MSDPKIIVAFDFAELKPARELLAKLEPSRCRIKIGKQMFTLFGPEFVREVVAQGFDVFLDTKFHDIPNTVANACKAAAELGVWMVNVHALGGRDMLCAAREALTQCSGRKPLLIAVTILTSMVDADLKAVGLTSSVEEEVMRLSTLAKDCSLDGVVCSAMEARRLKELHGDNFKLVTPGIRLPEDGSGDQKRVVTPQSAIANGSDYLVIGRSITQSENPERVIDIIQKQIS